MAKKKRRHTGKLSRLEKTAFHEAGHAVIALALGTAIRRASIVPGDDGSLGHVLFSERPKWFNPDLKCDSRTERLIRVRIMALMAGSIAEAHLVGRHNHKCAGSDYQNLVNLGSYVCGSIKETELYLAWLWEATKGMVRQDFTWHGIEALASELLEKKAINGRRVRHLVNEAIAEFCGAH